MTPTSTPAARIPAGALVAVLGLAALTGCSAASENASDEASTSGAPTTAAPTPSASDATAGADAALSAADLESLFTGIEFRPGEYDTTAAMLESIYPGLTVSDVACLAPFGAGWESGSGGAVEFGTSNDRSMTAVVASTPSADDAAELVSQAEDAIARCADGQELFAMQGAPVTTTVEPFELALTAGDEARGWRVTGDVGGSPFSLVGATVRVGQNALALVGWDPQTNADYVPMATQMFVDRIEAAG